MRIFPAPIDRPATLKGVPSVRRADLPGRRPANSCLIEWRADLPGRRPVNSRLIEWRADLPGRHRNSGFTLLEALLALVILLLAVQIAGQSLLSVVRVSRDAALDRQAAVIVRNIASDVWLGGSLDDLPARHTSPGWTLAARPLPTAEEDASPAVPWTLWTLSSESTAFLPVELAFTRRPKL
ncbi:MAG: prepilin-type N-terminal cleavage/methylation domain-containing protein [Kiritimatiellia bacterium]